MFYFLMAEIANLLRSQQATAWRFTLLRSLPLHLQTDEQSVTAKGQRYSGLCTQASKFVFHFTNSSPGHINRNLNI